MQRYSAYLILFAAACAGPPAQNVAVEVTDSAGIQVVQNGRLSEMPLRVLRRPVYRTGWRANEPEFESIFAGALLADGSAVVVDDGSKLVYRFEPKGEVEWTAGGAGQGPGELGGSNAIEVGATDSVFVWDYMNGRLSVFTPSGQFGRSVTRPELSIDGVVPGAVTTDGILWVPFSYSPDDSRAAAPDWFEIAIRRSDLALDSIARLTPVPMVRASLDRRRDPFMPFGVGGAYVGGVIWGGNDRPELRWYDDSGHLTRISRWGQDSVAVSDSVWSAYERAYYFQMTGNPETGTSDSMRRRLEEQRQDASETLPFFRWVVGTREGGAWIGEYTLFALPATEWAVFDPSGRLQGRVQTENPFRILDIRGSRILVVETDEYGVQAIAVYEYQ